MSIFSKAAVKISQRIDKVQSDMAELLPTKVSKEVQQQRLDICLSCDKLYVVTKTCKVCGCLMLVKTWMPKQVCPLNKWLESAPDNKE